MPLYQLVSEHNGDIILTNDSLSFGIALFSDINSSGFNPACILGYFTMSPTFGTTPVLEYKNELTGKHFYTVDPTEIGTTNTEKIGYNQWRYVRAIGHVFQRS